LELEEAIMGRRSVRVYTDEPVPIELVRKALEAGTWAPSAKNGQQWRFTVLTGESKRKLIEAMREGLDETAKRIGRGAMGSSFSSCAIMEEAPVVIMIWNAGSHAMSAAGRVAIFLRGRGAEDLALWAEMEGVSAAVQNMLLEAYALGLGSLWICDVLYAYSPLRKHLGKGW
jgi:nitroreductase